MELPTLPTDDEIREALANLDVIDNATAALVAFRQRLVDTINDLDAYAAERHIQLTEKKQRKPRGPNKPKNQGNGPQDETYAAE